MREAVISSETEISVQLDRRGKVFDSLLATVKNILVMKPMFLLKSPN